MADFEYDVFLSHNSKDKPNVERLAERLEDEAGITVFLDKWNLVPGDPWQEELERALECSRAVAVFLGPSGISSWHNEEMRSAIDRRTHNKEHRVIPVLLPDTELPEKHRLAVSWHYIRPVNPSRARKQLGVTLDGLQRLVIDGRQMLINRGC